MDHRHHSNDPRAAGLHATVARSPIEELFRAMVSRRREQTGGRFQGPYDAGRLVALGILVIDLAAIAIAHAVFGTLIIDYWPGMASLFAGLLFAIIIIRLGRPILYSDWIANGMLHVCLGLILTNDADLLATWSTIGFYAGLVASALATTWIGISLPIENGIPSLVAGGLASLVVAIIAIIDGLTVQLVAPDVILATMLLLLGLSTSSFGSSLRRRA